MKWLHRPGDGGGHALLLFGSGLIGSAIEQSAARQGFGLRADIRWDWTDTGQRTAQRAALPATLGETARIDIVWSAGVSGFSSSVADMDVETGYVAELLDLAGVLERQSGLVVLHLFSSIGALFEGQSWIDERSVPLALRPYGLGKLRQEEMVLGLTGRIVPCVYRPSSVYGYARRGRRGLFAAIIAAMLTHRPATIYGSPHTLRDYVFAQDIGDFLASQMMHPVSGPSILLLGSGKPTSLNEAISTIEAQVGRRYYGRFDKTAHNALDMTVRASALPSRLKRTPLRLGINLVYQNMLRSLVYMPR